MTNIKENELILEIKNAFKSGIPNGWLLKWKEDRFFEEILKLSRPYECKNETSFDYSFCNKYCISTDNGGDEKFYELTIRISFITDVYSIHWTTYYNYGKNGSVIDIPQNDKYKNLTNQVVVFLNNRNFCAIEDEIYNLPIDIELELSEKNITTIGKCLFEDYEG